MTNSSNTHSESILSKVAMVLGGYQAGFEMVKGTKSGAIETFTVVCSGGVPRLLLPSSRPMMRTAMTSFVGGSRLVHLMPPILQLAAKAGGPFSRLSSTVSLMSQSGEPCPLRQLVSGVLDRNDFQLALRVSFGRPNAKTVVMAISDSGESLCYVKLGSESMTGDLVAHESAVLEQFEHADMPLIVPARLYSGTWAQGQNVLITGPLPLEPLGTDASHAHVAADALASKNGLARSALADSEYWGRVVDNVGGFENSEALRASVATMEGEWGDTEFDFGISHGDWTRANIGMVDGSVAAIDWERCTMLSPRGIDIAHFALYEKNSRTSAQTQDLDLVAQKVRQYLKSTAVPSDKAEPLILFALLEMVIRFKSAENAGIRSKDDKFGPALQEGVRKWAQ